MKAQSSMPQKRDAQRGPGQNHAGQNHGKWADKIMLGKIIKNKNYSFLFMILPNMILPHENKIDHYENPAWSRCSGGWFFSGCQLATFRISRRTFHDRRGSA